MHLLHVPGDSCLFIYTSRLIFGKIDWNLGFFWAVVNVWIGFMKLNLFSVLAKMN